VNQAHSEPESIPAPEPLQFGLQVMFIAMTVTSLWLAVFAWYGLHAAIFMVFFMAIPVFLESAYYGLQRWYLLGYTLFGTCVGLLWFAGLELQSAADVRAAAATAKSNRNFKQIQLALMQYHTAYQNYPPVVTFNAHGAPQHSWRALILSDMDRLDLASDYHLDEPWDGPRNAAVRKSYIPTFHSPTDWSRYGMTNYLAIVTPQARPGEKFAIVEMPNTGIESFEPRDISLDALLKIADQAAKRRRKSNLPALRILWAHDRIETVPLHALRRALEQNIPAPRSKFSPRGNS
jgi:hypothetical protein